MFFVLTCVRHWNPEAMLHRIVCVYQGCLKLMSGNSDHGDTLVIGYKGTRVPSPKHQTGFGSDSGLVTGNTRPGKTTGYPGSKRTCCTPSTPSTWYWYALLTYNMYTLYRHAYWCANASIGSSRKFHITHRILQNATDSCP